MIKINLLGDSTAVDHTAQLSIAAYVGSILLALSLFYYMSSSIDASIIEQESKAQSLQNELSRVQKITKEVKDLEIKRAEYNNKLVVIATLKKSKAGPVRVLDDLNIALPEKAWLTQIKEQEGGLEVVGRTIDNQTVASFMRELQKSEYFAEPSSQVIKQIDQDGVKIKEFSFNAKVFYTGKLAAQQAQEAVAENAEVLPAGAAKPGSKG